MPTLYVSSLSRLHDVAETIGASHVVSLVNAGTPFVRPKGIVEDNHLFLAMNDVTEEAPGLIAPGSHHVRTLIEFVSTDWDRKAPLLIHCWAGISRSTAAAIITAAALQPDRDEVEIAQTLRQASPSATPNARLIGLADGLLNREGRLIRAVAAIGRGADAFEGTPFELPLR